MQPRRPAEAIPDKIKGASVRTRNRKGRPSQRAMQAWKKNPAFGSFDMFGRDAQRIYYDASVRRSKTNYLSAEFQDCFGHALVEVLRLPTTENETHAVIAGLRVLADNLQERGIVATFAFAPNDNVEISTAFVAAGVPQDRAPRAGDSRRRTVGDKTRFCGRTSSSARSAKNTTEARRYAYLRLQLRQLRPRI